jgi:C4-type Zn-finger protein
MTSLTIIDCPKCDHWACVEHEYYFSEPLETKITECEKCGYKNTETLKNETFEEL